MNIKPRTKIFVRPDPKQTKVGSILLAEEAQTTVETGTVVFGLEDLKEGDRVIYDKALTIPYKDLLVIDSDDIWGVIEAEEVE